MSNFYLDYLDFRAQIGMKINDLLPTENMPGLSYTLISNQAIKSHTYLDFVRTVLKAKGKQHWNLWDFHKTIYWYLGIKKFKKCWEIKISEDIFEDILQTILLIKDW